MGTVVSTSRTYLPNTLVVNGWDDVAAYFAELQDRTITDVAALERWLKDLSELEAVLSEEGAWRYIRMSLDTRDAEVGKRYNDFNAEVLPNAEQWTDKLQRKLMALPQVEALTGEGFPVYLRGIREQLRIFRETNLPIQVELRGMAQEYGAIIGAMNVTWKGEQITLPVGA